MNHIRASSTDSAWACAMSVGDHGGDPRIDPPSPPADTGNAAHLALAEVGRGNEPDLDDLAERYGADIEELSMLVAIGRRTWREKLAALMPEPLIELQARRELGHSHFELTGTLDLLSYPEPKLARVVDWKSGHLEESHYHQLRAYGWLAAGTPVGLGVDHEAPELVELMTIHLRAGVVNKATLTRKQLDAWAEDYLRRVSNAWGRYSPGPTCAHCEYAATCQGARDYQASSLALFRQDDAPLVQITPENAIEQGPILAEHRKAARFIRKRLGDFDDAATLAVQQCGGSVPAGPGRKLAIVPQNRKRVKPLAAWPLMVERFSEQQIADAMKVSLTVLQDHAAAGVEPGRGPGKGKGKAKLALVDDLRAAGAIDDYQIEQLREVNE